jgi:hypothetical protein
MRHSATQADSGRNSHVRFRVPLGGTIKPQFRGLFGPIWCQNLVVQNRCESKTAAQRVFRPSCGAQESLLFEMTSDCSGSCSRRRCNPAAWDTNCNSVELDANGDSLLETPRCLLPGCQRKRVNSNSSSARAAIGAERRYVRPVIRQAAPLRADDGSRHLHSLYRVRSSGA